MTKSKTIRKYPANKGNYFMFIVVSLVLPLLYMWLLSFQFKELIPYSFIAFVPFLFLLWIYCSTSYHITNGQIYYRSAFVRGAFAISDITEIEWVNRPKDGVRPALASTGIAIHYGQGNRVFLAPMQPKYFVKTVLKSNPAIVVTRKRITSQY
ncbi:PH domain-containing protein [Flavobacterium sp. JP2137]|uniref:PH domain-containing protein n=1 Tax=Flavobacterium sp. JP2137 TaxID=3414510 RepID=UPI003D2FE105